MNVPMYGLDVAVHPSGRSANRERSRACHRSNQCPTLGGQQPEEEFGRREANVGALLATFEGIERSAADRIAPGNA